MNDDVGTMARIAARLRPSRDERPRFVEGLALGALVGAAIAGSTLWARLRESRRSSAEHESERADRPS
jgi:hypothetical protein